MLGRLMIHARADGCKDQHADEASYERFALA